MKALRFDFSIPRLLLGKSLGWLSDSAFFGALSGLSLVDLPDPALPGPEWVRLKVVTCGICGSDVAGLTFKTSAVVEPFLSLPSVLGHEVLGKVTEVGPAVTRVKVGDRVSIDPVIACDVRGRVPRCASCEEGSPATCAFAGESYGPTPHGAPLARGLLLGANSDLPGGFGELIVAHDSQLFRVPETVEDNVAVLTEPLSISVHAILQSHHDHAAATLVIGSGPIALGAVWALRALGHHGPIVAQTKRQNEAALARELGASDTPAPGKAARNAMLATGARPYQPIVGPEVFAGGGFATVFDCVGSQESLDQALRFVAPRGKIILLGCAGELAKLDLTFLWAREVRLGGFVGYGMECWRGERLHTFEVTHRLMTESRAPLGKLVSHSFPLASYQSAFRAAARRSKSRAFKVLLMPH